MLNLLKKQHFWISSNFSGVLQGLILRLQKILNGLLERPELFPCLMILLSLNHVANTPGSWKCYIQSWSIKTKTFDKRSIMLFDDGRQVRIKTKVMFEQKIFFISHFMPKYLCPSIGRTWRKFYIQILLSKIFLPSKDFETLLRKFLVAYL